MHADGSDDAGSDPAASYLDSHCGGTSRQVPVVERLSKYGMQVMPSPFQRRLRLQERSLSGGRAPDAPNSPATERASGMRKKYLKDLLFRNSTSSGLGSVLTYQSPKVSPPEQDARCAMYPMEHAWMLSAVDGNYDTLLEFITQDPNLLTKRDFISGYSVLHWVAKGGRDDTLLELLRYAEKARIPVNVDVRGSGGLTPLHIASMHSHYMVVKLLVGAFGASVDAMDYNGKRAWQYLRGDAPPEMRELLGTWDDEHCSGRAGNANCNCNNIAVSVVDKNDELDAEKEFHFSDRTKRGSWRFGSLKKLLPSFHFLSKND